jgi:hypothetical protein
MTACRKVRLPSVSGHLDREYGISYKSQQFTDLGTTGSSVRKQVVRDRHYPFDHG